MKNILECYFVSTSYLTRHNYIVLQNSSNKLQYTSYIYSLSYAQFSIRDISSYFKAQKDRYPENEVSKCVDFQRSSGNTNLKKRKCN